MRSWLKKIWRRKQPTFSGDAREVEAKQFLDNLRENELSVGAALRRGEAISAAPGQVFSVESASVTRTPQCAQKSVSSPPQDAAYTVPTEDLATLMVVGAATGSAMLGYAAGGSLAGGMIGAALNETVTSSSTLEN